MSLVYGSVCSGIEAASIAWRPLGWRPAFFSEIDPFARAVLVQRRNAVDARLAGAVLRGVPLFGDFTAIRRHHLERLGIDAAIDLLVGGTPCQSFSIAGLRGGLDDARGNLALQYLLLARRLRPRWLVWENVPGVLSSRDGRDFGSIIGGMVELGYGVAWRVLDAQHIGVPQRRRRVFVVGYLGDWRRAVAVLFESHSLSGYPPPRYETRQDNRGRSAETVAGRSVARALTAHGQRQDAETETFIVHTLRGEGFDASEDGTGRGTPIIPIAFDVRGRDGGVMPEGPHDSASLRAASGGSSRSLIAFSAKDHGADAGPLAPTLRAGAHDRSHANAGIMPAITDGQAVRRLTPRECERLQEFPDDDTLIQYRGKPAADGPRYRVLGNSMHTGTMRLVGNRIARMEMFDRGFSINETSQ